MEKTFRKLLNIAHSINNEYGNLEYYSSCGMEDTNYFRDSIMEMEKYSLMEEDVCSTLDIKTVREMLDKFPDSFYEDDDLTRCYDTLMTKYHDLLYEMTDSNPELVIEDEIDFSDRFNDDELSEGIDEYLDEYDVLAYKYLDSVMCYIYVNAIKKLVFFLNETKAFNKEESKLKKRLQKDFMVNKYNLFLRNGMFEKIALLANYNPNKIPCYSDPQMLLENVNLNNIYYNEVFAIILETNKLYYNYGLDDEIISLLFLTLCFEEMINHLDYEQLIKVHEFLDNLSIKFKNSLPGISCITKIRQKEKEFN